MNKIKIETCPVPLSVAEDFNNGLPLPTVIDDFPSHRKRFVSDESTGIGEVYPLAMGHVVDDAGIARNALLTVSEERSRTRRVLRRVLGRSCVTATVLSLPF